MKFIYKDFKVDIKVLDLLEPLPDISFDKIIGDIDDLYVDRHIIQQRDANGSIYQILLCHSGDYTLLNSGSALQKNESIYFCSGQYVCKWHIFLKQLLWAVELDASSCFTLQFIENELNLLVSAESVLSKIDINGDIIWCYFGSDIFVTESGKSSADIIEDKIYITDWNNLLHVLDFDGKLLEIHDRTFLKTRLN